VGADDYLTKPTQPRELFAHVKAVLARGGKGMRAAATPPPEKGMVLGVLSAKGGLGLTTLAVNLGVMLKNRTNREVIVAEFRPGEGSISQDLGYTKPEGLIRLLNRKANEITHNLVEKELVTHTSGVRLLMSSYQPQDGMYTHSVEQFEAIATQLAFLAAYVIIDMGPSLTPLNEKVLKHVDELVVVTEPVPYTITRTKLLLDELEKRGFGEGRTNIVLVNRIRSEMQLSWTQVRELLAKDLAVAFTPAPEITYQAAKINQPLVMQQPESLTAQQFTKLADQIAKHVRQKV
jgi:pilus assembly protein CpaE